MLGVLMMGMVMSCDPDGNTENDPLNGRSVEEKYWGLYKTNLQGEYQYSFKLENDKFISYDPFTGEINDQYLAYTDDNKLYLYQENNFVHWGTFESDDKTIKTQGIGQRTYTKQENQVGIVKKIFNKKINTDNRTNLNISLIFRGSYKEINNNLSINNSTFKINLTRNKIFQILEFNNHPELSQIYFESTAWSVNNNIYIPNTDGDYLKGKIENNILTIYDIDTTMNYIKV